MLTPTIKQLTAFRKQNFTGQYVTIDIEYSTEHANAAMQKLKSTGNLAVFSLLKHENKLSIMHCNVQRNEMAGDTSIIKSKEELYFQVIHFISSSFFLAVFLLFSYFFTLKYRHSYYHYCAMSFVSYST